MVLKNAVAAAICAGILLPCGAARADEYRASEFLTLDLSSAVLSPKRLGPETQFTPVRIEAKADRAPTESRLTKAAAPRAKLAKHGNPLDAQARDTRIQTWPCKSGGICDWRR